MSDAVAVDGVVKAFGPRTVLVDVSASFPWGSATAIIGPNGSGKSVLLRMLSGLLAPTAGSITYDASLLRRNRQPTDIGLVIDGVSYLPGLSGRDYLVELSKIRRIASNADVDQALEEFGLSDVASRKARTYSLGMKQRLSLAQATFEGQRLLILDEAFNGLDTEHLAAARASIRARTERGSCVIFTSHSAEDVRAIATQTLLIREGRLFAA